jgi:hypothetical protein
MPGGQQFGYDRGADVPRRPGDEYAHCKLLQLAR